MSYPHLCPICKGRGEVAAGVTEGVRKFGLPTVGYDWKGNKEVCYCIEPLSYRINPMAWDSNKKDWWILETNPFGPLWGIAVCIPCHGTGLLR